MIELTLTLKITTAQVVETSVTVNNTFNWMIKLNLLLNLACHYASNNSKNNLGSLKL